MNNDNNPVYCPTCKQFTTTTTNYNNSSSGELRQEACNAAGYEQYDQPYCRDCCEVIRLLTLADMPAALAAYVVYKLRENLRLDEAIEEVKRGETIELGDFTHFNSIEELMADLNDSSMSGELLRQEVCKTVVNPDKNEVTPLEFLELFLAIWVFILVFIYCLSLWG